MPAVSESQRRWLYTDDAKKKLGAAGAKEWKQSSTGLNLPEKNPIAKFKAMTDKRKKISQ
jgi:hypothetical protein